MRASVITLLALFAFGTCFANSYRNGNIAPKYLLTSQAEPAEPAVKDKAPEEITIGPDEGEKSPEEAPVAEKEVLDIKKEEEEFAKALLETKKKEKERGEKENKYEVNKFDKYLLFLAKRVVNTHKTCRTRKDCLKKDLKTLEIARNSQRSVTKETYYTGGNRYGNRYGYNYGKKKQERKKVTVRDQQILATIESIREEIKSLPDQELFNISPIIFKEMSEKGWERWGLSGNESTIVEPLVRIRRIENIAEATFDDIAIYMLTKVEEAYARCDSRDKCSNDAAKVLQNTTEELGKLRNKLNKKKESHKALHEQISDVIDKVDAMQASARTEESQEIYDTVAKLIMPKVDKLTEEQFLAEMKKIGYKLHLETNHEYWYRVYEGKIRDRSKRYERKYEVIGTEETSKTADPDKKLKSVRKGGGKTKGMLNTAKNNLTQNGLNMTQVFMHSMMGMLMGKMGVKAPPMVKSGAAKAEKAAEPDDGEFGKLGLGSGSSKSSYSSSYGKSNRSYDRYNKYR